MDRKKLLANILANEKSKSQNQLTGEELARAGLKHVHVLIDISVKQLNKKSILLPTTSVKGDFKGTYYYDDIAHSVSETRKSINLLEDLTKVGKTLETMIRKASKAS